MHREVKTSEDLRQNILTGIKEVADVVSKTLGPKGRNVVLDTNEFADPIVTNDGVTIVREFNSKDKWKNIGIKLVREVAGKTNDQAGDGTTTATILFYEMCKTIQRALTNETNSLELREGIEKITKEIVKEVKNQAVKTDKLEDLVNIATISCGNKELGKTIANLVSDLGSDAIVAIEDSPEDDTVAEKTEGLRLRGGILSQAFVTNQAQLQAVVSNVPILVTNIHLSSGHEMEKIMEVVHAAGKKEAVVISDQIEGAALLTAVVNKLKNVINIIPVRVQAYGKVAEGYLEDVAKVTGGTYFTAENGFKLSELTINNFGQADKVVSTREQTTIIGGSGDKAGRIEELEAQIKADDLDDYHRDSLRERIAKLKSALGVVKVGGVTDIERNERKHRVEDAVNAVKAALTDGIVPGGASTLYRAIYKVNSGGNLGSSAVIYACNQVLIQLCENSNINLSAKDYSDLIENSNYAVDFRTGETVHAFENGIVDPVKVLVSALQNAAAQAGAFATMEGGLIVLDDPNKPQQQ